MKERKKEKSQKKQIRENRWILGKKEEESERKK